jgi:hypothetical protein
LIAAKFLDQKQRPHLLMPYKNERLIDGIVNASAGFVTGCVTA